MVTAESGPNPELADMTRRFWIGLALTMPVFVLEMGGHLTGAHHAARRSTLSNWLQFVLATPVVLWAGWPFFERGWQSLDDAQSQHVHADRHGHRRRLDLQRCRHACCPASSRRPSAVMTARSRSISRPPPSSPCWCSWARCWNCARASGHRAPSGRCSTSRPRRRAASNADGGEEDVALDQVAVGDRLRVRPGEKVPVDGDRRSRAARRSMNRW